MVPINHPGTEGEQDIRLKKCMEVQDNIPKALNMNFEGHRPSG